MVKVLVSDPIADKGLEILEEAGFDIVYNPNPSDDELQGLASDTNAWIVRSGTKITSELLKDARNLQVIGRAGVGVDNIAYFLPFRYSGFNIFFAVFCHPAGQVLNFIR